MKNKGCLYVFFALFALAGLACGVWGVESLMARNHILNGGIKTKGIVIGLLESRGSKGSLTYAPVVEFQDSTVGKVVYNSDTYTNMDPYEVGDTVNLWYLPSNPEVDVILEGSDWWHYFPFIFLLTHGGIGIGGIIWMERKRRLYKWLNEQGQEVNARFVRVDVHRGKSTSYTLVCEWKDPYTGMVNEFKSDSMSLNPEGFVSDSAPVRVLIDPANPKRYWVDTTFMDG